MKRLFFLFALCLFGGAWFYDFAVNTPGYMLLVIGNLSVELSLWFALVALVLVLVLTLVVLKLTRGGLRGARSQVKRVFMGSSRRAQQQMSKGFIHFFEGNWKQAEKLLAKSASHSPTPLLNYLGAARSAYELGDVQQANELLLKAESETPDAELSVILTQARMLYVGNKLEQCTATLERGRKLSPHNPVILDLLGKVYFKLQDWKNLELLLPELRRYSLINESELESMAQTVYRKRLEHSGQSGTLDALHQCWHKIPKDWQRRPEILLAYAELLVALGATSEAESLLRKGLRDNWDDRLVLCYGKLGGEDVMSQLLHAERWLQERPGNPVLLLTLGRLSLRNELWGKARDYFESSIKIKPTPAAYAENARLLAHLGEHQLSTEFYQQGLILAADHLPELPMPESRRRTVIQ